MFVVETFFTENKNKKKKLDLNLKSGLLIKTINDVVVSNGSRKHKIESNLSQNKNTFSLF